MGGEVRPSASSQKRSDIRSQPGRASARANLLQTSGRYRSASAFNQRRQPERFRKQAAAAHSSRSPPTFRQKHPTEHAVEGRDTQVVGPFRKLAAIRAGVSRGVSRRRAPACSPHSTARLFWLRDKPTIITLANNSWNPV